MNNLAKQRSNGWRNILDYIKDNKFAEKSLLFYVFAKDRKDIKTVIQNANFRLVTLLINLRVEGNGTSGKKLVALLVRKREK